MPACDFALPPGGRSLLSACVGALPMLFSGQPDAADRYQAEVMRLAPAPKFDSRQLNAKDSG